MRKSVEIIVLGLLAYALLLGACATEKRESTSNANGRVATSNSAANANVAAMGETSSEVPAVVRAALADAQTVTVEKKELSASQLAEVEREAGTKVQNATHTTYFGYASSGGARRQVGAATLLTVDGRELVIVYESRNGLPYIKEVRAEGLPSEFLAQFRGKRHDDPLQLGRDVQTRGLDQQLARAIVEAIRLDTRVMQALYGAPHTH